MWTHSSQLFDSTGWAFVRDVGRKRPWDRESFKMIIGVGIPGPTGRSRCHRCGPGGSWGLVRIYEFRRSHRVTWTFNPPAWDVLRDPWGQRAGGGILAPAQRSELDWRRTSVPSNGVGLDSFGELAGTIASTIRYAGNLPDRLLPPGISGMDRLLWIDTILPSFWSL